MALVGKGILPIATHLGCYKADHATSLEGRSRAGYHHNDDPPDRDDIVLDPFAGSNTLGMVAERLGRRWVAIEREKDHLEASRFRFEELD